MWAQIGKLAQKSWSGRNNPKPIVFKLSLHYDQGHPGGDTDGLSFPFGQLIYQSHLMLCQIVHCAGSSSLVPCIKQILPAKLACKTGFHQLEVTCRITWRHPSRTSLICACDKRLSACISPASFALNQALCGLLGTNALAQQDSTEWAISEGPVQQPSLP